VWQLPVLEPLVDREAVAGGRDTPEVQDKVA